MGGTAVYDAGGQARICCVEAVGGLRALGRGDRAGRANQAGAGEGHGLPRGGRLQLPPGGQEAKDVYRQGD